METNSYHTEERQKVAALKVRKIRNFFIHLAVYVISVVVYVLKTYCDIPLNFLPIRYLNLFVMAIWTLIIAIDAIGLFMSEIIFGKKWEERQIRKRMEKISKKQIWK